MFKDVDFKSGVNLEEELIKELQAHARHCLEPDAAYLSGSAFFYIFLRKGHMRN